MGLYNKSIRNMKSNNLKNREIKLGDLLFYVAYFLFIFSIIFLNIVN